MTSMMHLGPRARMRVAKLIQLATRIGQAAGEAAVGASSTVAQVRTAVLDAYQAGVIKAAGETSEARMMLSAAAAGLPVDEYCKMLEFRDADLDAALTTLNDPAAVELERSLEKSLAAGWTGIQGKEPGWSALYEDPYEPMALHGGYRERPSLITYEMIDAVAYRLGPFVAYTQNRSTKATQYSRPQEDRHGVGFIIRKRDERWKTIGGSSQSSAPDAGTELRKSKACRNIALAFKNLDKGELLRKANPSGQPFERPDPQEQAPQPAPAADPQQGAAAPPAGTAPTAGAKTVEVDPRVQELTAILMNCGKTPQEDADGDRRDGFPTFVHKIVRDSLFYDQINFEKQRDRKGNLLAWQAIDAKSVRSARRDTDVRNVRGEKVRFAQVIHGVIAAEFSARDLAFRVRNPRTDIRSFGYGLSEIEMAISVVTALLNGFDHNARYFCASGDTRVATRSGLQQLVDLVGTAFEIWNGRAWRPATAVETGRRPLVRTKLWNGLELKTSPDHKFRVLPRVPETGAELEPVWREQRALHPGDSLLVNVGGVEAPLDAERFGIGKTIEGIGYQGRDFTPTQEMVEDPKFWEMIGFALGDGYWPQLKEHWDRGEKCKPGQDLLIFPHPERDAELREQFFATCTKYGINAREKQYNKHIERPNGEHGYPIIAIGHGAFVRWLYSLGFKPSTGGKRVADALYQAPIWLRGAVLRGWFSADGHTNIHQTGYRTPTLACVDPVFRHDALMLLWSVGVASNDVGTGWNRNLQISVQDTQAFVERVGYLQSYKNEGIKRSERAATRWDKLHPPVAVAVAELIAAGPRWLDLGLSDRSLVGHVRKGGVGLSRPRAIRLLEQAGVDVPAVLCFHHVPVDVVDVDPVGHEQMFDVEVFDDEHAFLGNMVVVHNSQGTTAKGILAIHGLVPRGHLTAFKQLWQAMVSGAANAWRTPILNMADEKSSAKWIDIQKSNLDMEWSRFMDYLLKICCAVWQIAPEEIGFQFGNSGQAGGIGGQDGTKDKVSAGKDKGLRPLLEWLAQVINEEIVWELDPNYEFAFVGMDADSEAAEVELLGKKSATYMTINEVRASQDLPPRDDCEVIRDPTWLQAKGQAAAGAQSPNPGASPGYDGVDNYAPWDDSAGGYDDGGGQEQAPEPAAKSLTHRGDPRRLSPTKRRATVTRYEIAI